MGTCVLHVVQSLDSRAGSAAISLRGLFGELAARGCTSRLMLDKPSKLPPAGIDRVASDPTALRGMVEEADVVHIHGWGGRWSEAAAAEAKRRSKPYVVAPLGALSPAPDGEGSWFGRLRFRFAEAGLLRSAACVQAISDVELAHIEAAVPGAQATHLPHGLDFDAYGGGQRRDDVLPTPPGRSLLALGPVHPAEGLVMLLKAFAQLGADADGWTVVIAGEEIDDWREQLEAGVRRKGGGARVMFAGAGDERMQRGWLNRASLLVAPALRVRCPVSAMQAMACKVPVLATTLAAPSVSAEALQPCAPDAGTFVEALREQLTRSEPERVEAAEQTCRIAREALDWTTLGARYEELYERLRTSR